MVNQVIPRVHYADLVNGLSERQIDQIRRTGSVIVKGGVSKEVCGHILRATEPADNVDRHQEALSWKQQVRDYAAANPDLVRGNQRAGDTVELL